ncbi:MAG TPA: hypothetical protein VEX63_01730, partial [Flavisolibacter sp.]|nr:hypothetical protein [Flavisolibacter sp.]
MKKSILLSLIAGSVLIGLSTTAQEASLKNKTKKTTAAPQPSFQRCATSEGIRYRMQTDKDY